MTRNSDSKIKLLELIMMQNKILERDILQHYESMITTTQFSDSVYVTCKQMLHSLSPPSLSIPFAVVMTWHGRDASSASVRGTILGGVRPKSSSISS